MTGEEHKTGFQGEAANQDEGEPSSGAAPPPMPGEIGENGGRGGEELRLLPPSAIARPPQGMVGGLGEKSLAQRVVSEPFPSGSVYVEV